jgi:hypothetical protein
MVSPAGLSRCRFLQGMEGAEMTRQRKYQVEHKKRGLCVLCPKRLFNATHCKTHAKKYRKMHTDLYRRKHGIMATAQRKLEKSSPS